MTASKSLPPRPSLASLRKQARKIARERSLTLREAQLALAREYGFAGWRDLTAEVSRRLGNDLQSALTEARRAIHANDIVSLERLLVEHPALLSWRGDDRHQSLVEMAADAYGDAFGPEREHWFTRATCAELLIDAGAIVLPQVPESLLRSRAVGLLHLFERKGLLPRTLLFRAALGQADAVAALLASDASDMTAVSDAFICACRFEQEAAAAVLLERAIAIEPELGRRIDAAMERKAFVRFFIERQSLDFDHGRTGGLWRAFAIAQLVRAFDERDLAAFATLLEREPWLLADDNVWLQHDLIGKATLNGGTVAFVRELFDRDPAILRRRPPPASDAIASAFVYRTTDLLPLLTRIWPMPDDLPHAAGVGNLEPVKRWFDASGAPALGDLRHHYPHTSPHLREHDDLRWGGPAVQHVLDTALAFAVINRHFEVADFLLARGANIDTDWNSHEPASILHHLVFVPDPYSSMQFLIDRGIDMRIADYRWNSNAAGWARFGRNDDAMARWLEEAERRRARAAGRPVE